MEESEKILFTNCFGTITSKRVTLNYKTGIEDIPLNQVSSVSIQHKRNYFFSIASFLFAIPLIAWILNASLLGTTERIVIGLLATFLVLSGVANWIGHNNVMIGVSGQNRKPLKVEMAKTKEGIQFVKAIKDVVFK